MFNEPGKSFEEGLEPIQERLRQVFDALEISIYQAAKDLGENSSKFYNILNGRAKPSYDTIMRLLEQYPQVRADFLLRGQKPVLDEPEQNGRIIELEVRYMDLPFVPTRFYASFIETYIEGISMAQMETYRVPVHMVGSHKEPVVIEVSGNSMTPQLANGAKVLAILVDPNNWEYQSGGIYAVIYRDFFVVKRIKDNELLTKQRLTLHSDNPNGGSVTVPLKDIRGIWKIVRVIDSPVE
ncbi:LexA family transcriptional regulator [Larkinella rosea]|uniref:LexA family transcriptional regulator n=1 Tax=Larkinella rosea TaxID=2025312 RepID=A0A3P1BCM8_9BACT|nr:LexA family transcriptional regulator [Larkinella rosea]RRA98784.1 LexA family transcriptional regulator [Larkinella rosea]